MKKYNRQIRNVLWLLICFIGVAVIQDSAYAASKEATITKKTGYTIQEDELRKIMSKKLGTPYYKMDCSGYATWVLENMGNKKAQKGAIKNIKLTAGRSSFSWEKKGAVKISYKPAVYNEEKQKWIWGKKKKLSVNGSITKLKSYNAKRYKKAAKTLKIGDALIYVDHIALYFGEFNSAKEVVAYLKKECGMKGLKEGRTSAGNTCYRHKGKIVMVEYADCDNQWRIHATTGNGVIIDNDLTFHNGSYGGKWRATVRFVETTSE